MNNYMLIFRDEKNDTKPSAEQMQMMVTQWQQWISGIARSGNFVGTNRLLSEGRTIKGTKVISDGPYMEVKEMIGGYVIVKTHTIDEAVSIANGCPGLATGTIVEVRAVMNIDSDPESKSFLGPKS